MVYKDLKPFKPLSTVNTAKTVHEIRKDYIDNPCYQHDKRCDLGKRRFDAADEERNDKQKSCDKQNRTDDDIKDIVQLSVERIAAEISNAFDADDNDLLSDLMHIHYKTRKAGRLRY